MPPALPRSLADAPPAMIAQIRMLATDVDGTITRGGKVVPEVLVACARLAEAGVEVLPVTGRPAGELLGLVRYLPGITRGIAENGAVLVVPDLPVELLRPPPDRARLLDVADRLGRLDRPWRLSPDAFCRLGDVAWQRDGRTGAELARLRDLATAEGVWLVWSSVHIHLADHDPDKGAAVLEIARRQGLGPDRIATAGDSPNDIGLWVAGRFGLPVGTADVRDQLDVLGHLPAWVTVGEGATGWLELAQRLLRARGA